jgi:Glycosyl transferases group 1
MVTKVYAYPSDAWGCGAYRIKWPALAVNEPGMVVELVEPGTRKIQVNIDNNTGNVTSETFPEDADVVVLQRPTNRWMTQTIPLLQARGVAVVVELDDDLAHIHPSNPAFDMLQPVLRRDGMMARNTQHSVNWLREALQLADLVTVSTDELRDQYGAHGRIRVLRNRVPAYFLTVRHVDSDVIGWGGSVHSHPDDLQQVGASVAMLTRHGAEFRTVGDPADVRRVLGLRDEPQSTGPVELDDYPHAIGQFGIGIAPLADTRFNRAKSWLKPLEYAAVGVPWVASPLPEYELLHAAGCGRLAHRPKDWNGILNALLRSPALRIEMSGQGRMVAGANTIEGWAWEWAEAWADALTYRQQAVSSPRPGNSPSRMKHDQRGSLASRARRIRT